MLHQYCSLHMCYSMQCYPPLWTMHWVIKWHISSILSETKPIHLFLTVWYGVVCNMHRVVERASGHTQCRHVSWLCMLNWKQAKYIKWDSYSVPNSRYRCTNTSTQMSKMCSYACSFTCFIESMFWVVFFSIDFAHGAFVLTFVMTGYAKIHHLTTAILSKICVAIIVAHVALEW